MRLKNPKSRYLASHAHAAPRRASRRRRRSMLSLIKKTVTDAAHTLPFAAHAARDGEDDAPQTLTASGALVLDKLTGAARALCVAPDATLLSGSDDGGLRAWNTSSGRLMSQTKAFETDVAVASVRAARSSTGASVAACSSTDGRVHARDLTTGRVTMTMDGPTCAIEALCVLPKSGLIVGGDARGGIFVWDLADGERGADVECVALYPTWRFGVAAREFLSENAINAGGVADASPRKKRGGVVGLGKAKAAAVEPNCVRCVSGWTHPADPDAEFVASGAEDGTLTIWKMRAGRPVATFGAEDGGHRGAIYGVCDNDGVIVTAGADGRVLAWYVNERGELLGPPEEMNVRGKHTGAVFNVINIAPGIVCAAGADQRALVWDVRARRLMFECPSTKAGAVRALAFDADAGVLYTGTASSQIVRWELPSGDVLSPRGRGEELLLTRNFSAERLDEVAPMSRDDDAFDGFARDDDESATVLEDATTEVASNDVEERHFQEVTRLRLALKDARDESLRLKQADKKRSNYVRELEETLERERSSSQGAGDAALRAKCEKMETIARKQKTKLDELKGELKTARDEFDAAMRDKDAKCEELSAELERTREALDTAQKPEMSVEEMMAAAEKALESPAPAQEASQETLRELHATREELQMAQQDAAVAEKTISQLRSECESLHVQLTSVTDESHALAKKAEDFAQVEERLTQERDAMTTTAKVRDEEIARLTAQLSSMHDSESAVESLETEHADTIETLKKEHADAIETMQKNNDVEAKRLQADVEQSKTTLRAAEEKSKTFQDEAAQLRRQLEDKTAELDAMMTSNAQNDATAALAKSTEECQALKRQVEDAQRAKTDAEAMSKTHEDSIASLRRQVEELEASSSAVDQTLRAREEELQAATESLTNELATLTAAVGAKDAEIMKISEQSDKFKQKFDNAVKKGKDFQEEAARLRRELEEKSAELSAAVESKQMASATNAELESLRAQIKSRDVELAEMTALRINDADALDAFQSQLLTLEASLSAKDAEIERLGAVVEKSKQKFDNAVKRGKGFQDDATRLQHELDELKTQLIDARNASTSDAEELRQLSDDLDRARIRVNEKQAELNARSREIVAQSAQLEAANAAMEGAQTRSAQLDAANVALERKRAEVKQLDAKLAARSREIVAQSAQLDAANVALERALGELAARDDELKRLQSQLSSFNEAQQELARLRDDLEAYESEMDALKSSVETAKTKFANAVKKGKSYQEEAVSLREQLAAKDFELTQASSTKGASETRVGELTLALETTNAKLRDGLLDVEAKTNEVARLVGELKQSESRVEELERELEQSQRSAKDTLAPSADSRGQQWLEQQARAAVDERTRDLTEENERLRDEVAAATAAAAEAWQAVASYGVDRPGDSRPVSEIGSPARDGYATRARSLYQQPSYRGGAMSMIHERVDPMVPKSEYDKLKELCARLKRDLAHAKQTAKEAVQQVINRLEIEVMAKVHAEAAAKSAQAECERAWSHAKDALAAMQKNVAATAAASAQVHKPMSLADALKPQPPPGTRAASELEKKSANADALFVMRQEHVPSIIFAFLAFLVGALLSKT
jgi:WD40 repeat protein/chromosome segregation ATPase